LGAVKRSATILALAAVGVAGCGSTTPAPGVPTISSPQSPAALPHGWSRTVDPVLGVAAGVPPGWQADERGGSLLVRSPDHLTAVSITADRTEDALNAPLADLATRTLAALPASGGAQLQPAAARPFHGTPLEAVETSATGTAGHGGGVPQRLTLVVLRHRDYATFTAVIAANARRSSPFERGEAVRVVRSVRDYPVSRRPGPSYGVEPRPPAAVSRKAHATGRTGPSSGRDARDRARRSSPAR
jgi:hypothetical protein